MTDLIETARINGRVLIDAETFVTEVAEGRGGMVLAAAYISMGQARAAYEKSLQAIGEAVLAAREV